MKFGEAKDGFSLIEMLVVLTLIATISAVAVPYTKESGGKLRLRAVAQSVAALLQKEKYFAVSQNISRELTFDLKSRQLKASQGQSLLVLPNDMSVTFKTATNDSNGNLAIIRFFADGGSTGGTITFARGNEAVTLKLNWLTGATIIEDGPSP